MHERTAAIVVSYNNYHDSVECLESLARSSDASLSHVFLVDNSPTDASVSQIVAWLAEVDGAWSSVSKGGKRTTPVSCNELARLAALPGFSAREYITTALEAAPRRRFSVVSLIEGEPFSAEPEDGGIMLVIIRCRRNRGYAGGINAALAYGLCLGFSAFWVLNNDTIVHPGACLALKNSLFSCSRPGLAGGLVLYNDHPDMVQCLAGGYTSPVFFLSRLFGHTLPLAKALAILPEHIQGKLNFIYGASFMMSREFAKQVGPLNEKLFLYCEEQDLAWASRGRFDLAYAPGAIILHKEGRSTKRTRYKRPLLRLALIARNKVIVTLKYHPWALPTVLIGICISAARNCMRFFSGRL